MMRILGNSFAKFGRMGGRLQSRNFSSASGTAVNADVRRYLARAVAGGIGYMICGLILSEPVTKQAMKVEKNCLEIKQQLDERERELEAHMK